MANSIVETPIPNRSYPFAASAMDGDKGEGLLQAAFVGMLFWKNSRAGGGNPAHSFLGREMCHKSK